MLKFKKVSIKILYFAICVSILLAVPIISVIGTKDAEGEKQLTVLTVWQIDSFEGGKGSRANYLQKIADEFSKNYNCYFNVISLSEDAAKINLNSNVSPDLISYGAGISGIENHVKDYTTWCRGGYCLLTIDENGDFSDVSRQNTIINSGTGNYAKIAAILNGLANAGEDKPTGAYVKLVNGEFKYLLGTQRDIFRLKTREVNFKVKPITNFNDLYQNVSIVTNQTDKIFFAKKFIDFLLSESHNLTQIGLINDGKTVYDDEINELQAINSFEYKITSPISYETKTSLDKAINDKDENKLKNLLK